MFEPGYAELVRFLVDLRKSAGLTQEDLALKLGRHRSFVWKTEGGQRRIDLIEFVSWCRACKVDPDRSFRIVLGKIPTR